MIVYDKLKRMLKEKGITTYKIRKDSIIGQNALTAINHNKYISLDTVNRLCRVLKCQPGDILEFVEDAPGTDEAPTE